MQVAEAWVTHKFHSGSHPFSEGRPFRRWYRTGERQDQLVCAFQVGCEQWAALSSGRKRVGRNYPCPQSARVPNGSWVVGALLFWRWRVFDMSDRGTRHLEVCLKCSIFLRLSFNLASRNEGRQAAPSRSTPNKWIFGTHVIESEPCGP